MRTTNQPEPVSRMPSCWLAGCAALAAVQVLWQGYRYGVGNQSIQVTFLKHLIDPNLFARDALVSTLAAYPSLFFHGLARLLPDLAWIEPVYFGLHLAVAFLLLAAAARLAWSLTSSRLTVLFTLLALALGTHSGLAESPLYFPGFTHTWIATGVGVLCLAMFIGGEPVAAFGAAGLLFNVHALIGAYVLVLLGSAALTQLRQLGFRRLLWAGLLAVGAAGPTVIAMACSHQVFDAAWMDDVRLRSPNHVFATSWWTPGSSVVPVFALKTALGVVGFSSCMPAGRSRRAVIAMFLALAVLCGAGFYFAEVSPVALVMRAQLFRATQFAACLAVVGGAWLAASLLRPRQAGMAREGGVGPLWWFGAACGLAVLLVLLFPACVSWLPTVVLAASLSQLASGRLGVVGAAASGSALLISVIAWREIGFRVLPEWRLPTPDVLDPVMVAGLAAAVLVFGLRPGRRLPCLVADVCVLAIVAVLASVAGERAGGRSVESDAWRNLQCYVRGHVSEDDLILVPAFPGGFRLHSDRAVTGEWRDGTQQFFSSDFSRDWRRRMTRVLRDSTADRGPAGVTRGPGAGIESMDDDELAALAAEWGAAWIVLPRSDRDAFRVEYANSEWMLLAAEPLPPPPQPAGILDEEGWREQDRFMREVVDPNIRKYRQSPLRLVVVDERGRPLVGARYALTQTSQDFKFGCSLDHFIEPPAHPEGFRAPVMTAKQLARVKEVFNYSIIGYSAKWNALEPEEGAPHYENLDRYVDWCSTNGIGVQFHFVTGYEPEWLQKKSDADKERLLVAHAEQLVTRYGDRIRDWQVVNEKHLLAQSPPAFAAMRALKPDCRLGISDCARFYASARRGKDGERRRDVSSDMLRGLAEVRWLEQHGTQVDFFAFHGHRPFGLWADVRTMYEALDACAVEGVSVFISEFGAQSSGKIVGDLRGGEWTPELQAEYMTRFYSVCFSHPAVEGINIWGLGPKTWIAGAAIVDENSDPLPAFTALRRLTQETWRTSAEGRVAIDGTIVLRAFHGAFTISVWPEDGANAATAAFRVDPGNPNWYRLTLMPEKQTLDVVRMTPGYCQKLNEKL